MKSCKWKVVSGKDILRLCDTNLVVCHGFNCLRSTINVKYFKICLVYLFTLFKLLFYSLI